MKELCFKLVQHFFCLINYKTNFIHLNLDKIVSTTGVFSWKVSLQYASLHIEDFAYA